jgi:hypothetical protein
MLKKLSFVLAFVVECIPMNQGQAQVFVGTFPSASSVVVASLGDLGTSFGYFGDASRGDMVGETFAGTGLSAVSQLDLMFNVSENVLSPGAHVDWEVRLNGTPVGTWTWSDIDGTGPVSLSYSFAPIVGGGTYTIGMHVTNVVPPWEGSIALAKGGTLTLYGLRQPQPVVPEPGAAGDANLRRIGGD